MMLRSGVLAPALLFLACIFSAPAMAEAPLRASPWVELREASVRLIGRFEAETFHGGLEIRLQPGFKTYWRAPGDSGVPPTFDFTQSAGLGPVEVRFPFPGKFDDGAGGMAWGYKMDVIFPLVAGVIAPSPTLKLKLDFAVCGTMCIPMAAEIAISSQTPVADSSLAGRIEAANQAVPKPLPVGLPAPRAKPHTNPQEWVISLPAPPSSPEAPQAFAEMRGFADVLSLTTKDDHLDLHLRAEPPPGSNGKPGQVRISYGRAGAAYDVTIDLDAGPAAP